VLYKNNILASILLLSIKTWIFIMSPIYIENNLKLSALYNVNRDLKKITNLPSESIIKFPKKKKLFGEKIILSDINNDHIYPEDISQMFRWMQKINFSSTPTILDIGANIGMFSLSYASMFKGAVIHSFEPVNFIYNYLRRNLQINPNLSSNIKTYNFGISDCFEQKYLSIPTPQQHNRYTDRLDIRLYSVFGKGEKKFKAQFIPLDLWVDKFQIDALDFIKIDVEGYEYLVLDGAKKTLQTFQPIVMFELNELTLTLSKRKVDEYLHFAKKFGYNVFGLQYGFKSELLKIKSKEQVNLVSDLVLLPSSKIVF
jgi:FkbM family methyltransferase